MWSQDIYAKAWQFATVAHDGQLYGSEAPGVKIAYINHVGSVAMELIWALQQPETQIFDANLAIQAALLHDVIEDTAVSYHDIEHHFGQAVADGVMALSKDASLPTKDEQMRDSLLRIKAQPQEIWMVKMADRISNLYHPPHYWSDEKILRYRDEALLIHDALHTAHPILAKRLHHKAQDYLDFLSHQPYSPHS